MNPGLRQSSGNELHFSAMVFGLSHEFEFH